MKDKIRVLRIGMKMLTWIIVSCVLFILYVRYLEYTTVFHPERKMSYTPADADLGYENVFFKTSDGVNLHGWFIPFPEAQSTILFFHGNAGNISDRLGKIHLFHNLGVHVFIIDYRGYGKSEGRPSEQGLYKDAVASYDYLLTRADVHKGRIIVYGASLGGAVAIDLATQRKVAALIIDGAFSHAEDMAKRIFPFIPPVFIQIKLDSLSKINGISIPQLFFHSKGDEVVPYELGRKLFSGAREPKAFVELEGSHNDVLLYDEEKFRKSIKFFLDRYNL